MNSELYTLRKELTALGHEFTQKVKMLELRINQLESNQRQSIDQSDTINRNKSGDEPSLAGNVESLTTVEEKPTMGFTETIPDGIVVDDVRDDKLWVKELHAEVCLRS